MYKAYVRAMYVREFPHKIWCCFIWYSTSMFFGLMMLLVVCLMMDVTSCGSMAGSACAAFRAVGPCICSWFVWSYAPVRSTTEERWPQDAEDLSHCLSQEQSLQRKEEEDTRHCLKKYQCTDDCACIGPSIYCIRPSMHPCMHACIQLAKGKQTDRRMHQELPGLT